MWRPVCWPPCMRRVHAMPVCPRAHTRAHTRAHAPAHAHAARGGDAGAHAVCTHAPGGAHLLGRVRLQEPGERPARGDCSPMQPHAAPMQPPCSPHAAPMQPHVQAAPQAAPQPACSPGCTPACMHPRLHPSLHAPQAAPQPACSPGCTPACMQPRLHPCRPAPLRKLRTRAASARACIPGARPAQGGHGGADGGLGRGGAQEGGRRDGDRAPAGGHAHHAARAPCTRQAHAHSVHMHTRHAHTHARARRVGGRVTPHHSRRAQQSSRAQQSRRARAARGRLCGSTCSGASRGGATPSPSSSLRR